MSIPATLADAFTAATSALEALLNGSPDRCNVVNRTLTTGSYGGSTIAETTVASNVPILYEERIYGSTQVVGGTQSFITHDLYLISSSATRSIQPDHKIVVAARGDIPALIFEEPIRLDESLSPIVHLGAKLSTV